MRSGLSTVSDRADIRTQVSPVPGRAYDAFNVQSGRIILVKCQHGPGAQRVLSKDSSHKSGQRTLPLSHVLKCNSIHEFIQQSLVVSGANSSQRNPSLLHREFGQHPQNTLFPTTKTSGLQRESSRARLANGLGHLPRARFPFSHPMQQLFCPGA